MVNKNFNRTKYCVFYYLEFKSRDVFTAKDCFFFLVSMLILFKYLILRKRMKWINNSTGYSFFYIYLNIHIYICIYFTMASVHYSDEAFCSAYCFFLLNSTFPKV